MSTVTTTAATKPTDAPYDFGVVGAKAQQFVATIGQTRRGTRATEDIVDFFYVSEKCRRQLELKFRKTYCLEGYNLIGTLLNGVEALFVTVDVHDVSTAQHAQSVARQLVENYPLIFFAVRVLVLFDEIMPVVASGDGDWGHTRCTDADVKPVLDLLDIQDVFVVYTATDVYECIYSVIDQVSLKRNTSIPPLNLQCVVAQPATSSNNGSSASTPLASSSYVAPTPKNNSAPATVRTNEAMSPARETLSARHRSRLFSLRAHNSSPSLSRASAPDAATSSSSSSVASSSAITPQDSSSTVVSPLDSPKRSSSKKQQQYASESCNIQ